MCIFTDRVEKVSSTNIFAALVDPYTQLTVYSNKVALAGSNSYINNSPTFFNSTLLGTSNDGSFGSWGSFAPVGSFARDPGHNVFWEQTSHWSAIDPSGMQVYDPQGNPVAMVLAVPLVRGTADSIKMVDMSNNKDFFQKLKDTMPLSYEMLDGSPTFSMNAQSKGGSYLAVKRCGPYRYSIVPDVTSFERLRQKVFKVNPRVFQILKQHYPRGYAFLVCIIDKSAEYSPIAYVHPSDGKTLFIPTLHEHGHPGEEFETDDWDHSIYTIDRDDGTRLTDRRGIYAEIDRAATWPELPRFQYKNLDWSRLKRRNIHGHNPNGDIIIRA